MTCSYIDRTIRTNFTFTRYLWEDSDQAGRKDESNIKLVTCVPTMRHTNICVQSIVLEFYLQWVEVCFFSQVSRELWESRTVPCCKMRSENHKEGSDSDKSEYINCWAEQGGKATE